MKTFYLKQHGTSFKVVNACDCEYKEVAEIKCIVEQLDRNSVEVFEPSTGKVIYKGAKDCMKESVTATCKEFRAYMKSDEAKLAVKRMNSFLFGHIEEIYERMYK